MWISQRNSSQMKLAQIYAFDISAIFTKHYFTAICLFQRKIEECLEMALRHFHFLQLITLAVLCSLPRHIVFRNNRKSQFQWDKSRLASFCKTRTYVNVASAVHTVAVHPQSLGFVNNIFWGLDLHYDGIWGSIPTKLFLILLAFRSNIIMVSSWKMQCPPHKV